MNATRSPEVNQSALSTIFNVTEHTAAHYQLTADLTSFISDSDVNDVVQFKIVEGGNDTLGRICMPDANKLQLDACDAVGEDGYGPAAFDFESCGDSCAIAVAVQAHDLHGNESPIVMFVFVIQPTDERPRVVLTVEEAAEVASVRFLHGQPNTIRLPLRRLFVDQDAQDDGPTGVSFSLLYQRESDLVFENATILADNDFRASSPLQLQFVQSSAYTGELIWSLVGTPTYGPSTSLQQATLASPRPKQYVLRIVAEDSSGLIATVDFTLFVEVAGCRDERARWNAVSNPRGNYNPMASLP